MAVLITHHGGILAANGRTALEQEVAHDYCTYIG